MTSLMIKGLQMDIEKLEAKCRQLQDTIEDQKRINSNLEAIAEKMAEALRDCSMIRDSWKITAIARDALAAYELTKATASNKP